MRKMERRSKGSEQMTDFPIVRHDRAGFGYLAVTSGWPRHFFGICIMTASCSFPVGNAEGAECQIASDHYDKRL